MIFRLTIALPAAVLGAALFASSVPAQVRGMRGSAPGPRTGVSSRFGGRTGFTHAGHRRNFTGSVFLAAPYFYPDDEYDNEPVSSVAPPVQVVVVAPVPPPVQARAPVESLIVEYHDGQWVRIPTGGQLPSLPQSTQPGSTQASSLRTGTASQMETAQPSPALPPAVLVFRDGHREEVERYVIQGGVINARADYWSTGSWTRKIPIAELDVPATLKLNEERGGKFNLPSGPNEIVVRF
jgi:hypothetical protein